MRSPTASTFLTTKPRTTAVCGVRYARRPRRTRGGRGRGVRYTCTIVNAHHVSWACMQPPCPRLTRIMSPTLLPRPRTRLGVRLLKYVPHSPRKRITLPGGGCLGLRCPVPPSVPHSLSPLPPSPPLPYLPLPAFFNSCLIRQQKE